VIREPIFVSLGHFYLATRLQEPALHSLAALREIDDEAAALIPEVVLKFITCAEGCVISVEARHRYV
jgi:hypothetical protein